MMINLTRHAPAVFLALAFGLSGPAWAKVIPAPLFADHAVLQQGMPVPVWGKADPGELVTVTYLGQKQAAAAAPDGRWLVRLDPMKAGLAGELVIAGTNTIRLTDVVTGEVWLASGQSNMAFQLKNTAAAPREIAAANYPQIRAFNVVLNSSVPVLDTLRGRWLPTSPQTAGDFSGVGYYFSRALFKALEVPIGIINTSKGGSPVEAWMSAEALAASGHAEIVARRWDDNLKAYPQRMADYETKTLPKWSEDEAAARAAGKPLPPKPAPPIGPGDFRAPSGLYGGMIHPLIPYAIQGAIWYQGEANAAQASEYRSLFGALITDWRSRWQQGDFPFLFVQLPNLELIARHDRTGTMWANLRDAQARTLTLPRTGMAVTIDIGEPTDVHPKNKLDVGERLALLARSLVYGQDVSASGPVFRAAALEGGALRLSFDLAGGLAARNGGPLGGFEIAGADQVFHPATAVIEGGSIHVSSPAVPAPAAVRYAWKNNPVDANLINSTGLPAAPFQGVVVP